MAVVIRAFPRGSEDFVIAAMDCGSGGEARLVDVASCLRVSRAAASMAAARLARQGLVARCRYSTIRLTSKGRRLAMVTSMKRKIAEVFLHDKLGISGRQMERQAHALEHALSLAAVRRLDDLLGRPQKCPHGIEIARL